MMGSVTVGGTPIGAGASTTMGQGSTGTGMGQGSTGPGTMGPGMAPGTRPGAGSGY
jgi:hypothetical protein